jgi:hypothetical protein
MLITKEKVINKLINDLASVKVYILIMATFFFWKGNLTESSWKEIVLIMAGIRSADKMAYRYQKHKEQKLKGG